MTRTDHAPSHYYQDLLCLCTFFKMMILPELLIAPTQVPVFQKRRFLMKKVVQIGVLLAISTVLLMSQPAPSAAQDFFDPPLTALPVEIPPIIDGIADDATWEQAAPLVAEVKDGSIGLVAVTLRAVYDAENVYFLIEWADETESATDPEAGDRLAMLWQITEIVGFNIVGCNQACHSGYPEGMWFEEESERGDLWMWQAANTNALAVLDDRYFGFNEGVEGAEWRYHDPGELGSGSRADIAAQGVWANGNWTLELRRVLNTGDYSVGDDGQPVDVTFEVGQPYYFGLAIMDDSAADHSVGDFAIGFIMEGDSASSASEETTGDSPSVSIGSGEVHYDEVFTQRVAVPPILDGVADDSIWQTTDVSIVDVSGGAIRRVDVTIQAVYDDANLYMLLQWPDDTQSIDRRTWTYGRDGWERGEKEDRFSIVWQITEIEGFETIGCNIACHNTGAPTGMWFNNPGEFGDMWNWKAGRTNPMGYVDDGWMGANSGHPDGGRYLDPGTSSYARNETATGDAPGFIWANADAIAIPPGAPSELANHFLVDADVVPVDESMAFSSGDTVPGYVLRQPTGSRADIQARGVWANGIWTVELTRALDTGNHAVLADGATFVDVIFTPGETYYFSLVMMDDTDQDHSTEDIGIPFTLVE
jgi:hypothetical protein